MSTPDIKILRAKCFCGKIHFTLSIPRPSLPLSAFMCHCSICRYSTGAPCVSHTSLPRGLKPHFIAPSTEDNLTRYAVPGYGRTNDFCSTCGCHVAGVSLDRELWVISTSLLTDHGPANVRWEKHIFSKSSKDGSFAPLLTHIGGRELAHWDPQADQPAAKVVEPELEVGQDGKERLRVKCYCGGVSFTISRPVEEMTEDERLARCFKPNEKIKWAADFCVCDECRLIGGTHAVGWANIPLSVCEPRIKQDLMIGTSKTYSSSPGVLRSHCGECGADLLYSRPISDDSKEPHIVDLAVGVIRAPGGYMANNWLAWRPKALHLEDMEKFDKDFADAMRVV